MSLWIHDIAHAKTPLRFILAVSKPYMLAASTGFFFVTLAAIVGAVQPLIYKYIVDSVEALATGGAISDVSFWIWIYMAIYISELAAYRGVSLSMAFWETGVRVTARYALTEYILKHSNEFFENRFAGSLGSKISNAADGARAVVSEITWNFWSLLVGLSISIGLTFYTHPFIGWLFIGWLIIAVPLNIYLARKRIPYSVKPQQIETKLRGITVDIFGNIRAVKEYARNLHELGDLRNVILERRKAGLNNLFFGEFILLTNSVLQALFMSGMVAIAVYLASLGTITFGAVILVLTLVMSVGHSIFFLASQINSFGERWGEIQESLDDLLHPYGIPDKADAKPLVVSSGKVTFSHVHFMYPESNPVLSDFSLQIAPGQKIGLIGKSGAGKSTIMKLLLRHYEVTEGSISIDGQDISKVTQESLRDGIASIPQEPLLFHRTIRENIAYGKADATFDEIVAAATLAQAHEFIMALPQGYETLVGERGVKLSGGQRQRVAIARAIVKPAKILVLDEATSALDSESEVAIQRALHTLMAGKSVIAIAHRLSTLREMDRLIVLDGGKIIEDGSHDTLIKKGGVYADLWAHQSGGYLEDDDEQKLELPQVREIERE